MRKQTKTVIAVAVIVGVIGVSSWSLTRPATAKVSAPVAVPVKVVSVTEEDVPRFVTGIGSVLSLHSVVIRPQVDGILTKVLVKEGQTVKAGDLLATIDDRAIRATLEQARPSISSKRRFISSKPRRWVIRRRSTPRKCSCPTRRFAPR
jgi:multidrug efflux pump subunit AcrA (membrane-fusion protein)